MKRLLHVLIGHAFTDWYPLVMHGWSTNGRPEMRFCGCGVIQYNRDGELLTRLAWEESP